MYNLHSADVVPVVNEKTTEYKQNGRARFPQPSSGFEYIAEVLRSEVAADLSHGAQLIYIRLADYLGNNQKPPYVVRPHMATLARAMRFKDKRSARRLIKELEDAKLLRRQARKDGKQGYVANSYILCTPEDRIVRRVGTEMSSGERTEMSAHKETSSFKETNKKETTPYPLKGESGGVRISPDPDMVNALAEVCQLDLSTRIRKISGYAVNLQKAGYTADHVYEIEAIIRDGWNDYDGKITLDKILDRIIEVFPEDEQERRYTAGRSY